MGSFSAELLVLRKRTATWIVIGIAMLLGLFFGYVLPYTSYLSQPASERTTGELAAMLPEQAITSMVGGFPFYLGILALILSVMQFGGEYGWGTVKTVLMERPNRLTWFLSKLAALGTILAVFVVAVFATGAIASYVVASLEGAAVNWPSALDVARGLGAAWLILALWAGLGVLLAVLSRGTAMAIGLGILYGMVVEGLVSGFGARIALLQDIAQGFLRTNSYSLVAALGVSTAEEGGPGAFSGPFVDTWQALVVIVAYVVVFSGIAAMLIQRRDVA